MKVELTDVSETKKTLTVEVPPEVVDTEISRITQGYARQARIPGFRPGKAPVHVVRKRFREQILHDVAHDLVPRVVGDALRDKNVQPVDTPKVRDLQLEEGKPLTFTAAIETAPHVEPGDLATLTVQRPEMPVSEDDVDQALSRLRDRLAKMEPVEDRGAEQGDTVVMHLSRRRLTGPAGGRDRAGGAGEARRRVGRDWRRGQSTGVRRGPAGRDRRDTEDLRGHLPV